MKNSKITNGNPLPNEVEINLNMLGSLMLNRVGGHVDGADVVTIHQRSSAKRGMKLLKQLAQPSSLSDTVGHGAILSLGTGSGDSILTLGGPRDEIVPKKHSIARGGLACIRTTSPVSISIYHKISRGRWSQQKAEVESATNIAKDALQSRQVRCSRIMHVEADLLNSIGNVWPCEGQIL